MSAKELFDTHLAHLRHVDEVEEMLLDYGDFDDITYDYYDCSLEVYDWKPWDEPKSVVAFKQRMEGYGFVKVWLHPHPAGRTMPDGYLCKCPLVVP